MRKILFLVPCSRVSYSEWCLEGIQLRKLGVEIYSFYIYAHTYLSTGARVQKVMYIWRWQVPAITGLTKNTANPSLSWGEKKKNNKERKFLLKSPGPQPYLQVIEMMVLKLWLDLSRPALASKHGYSPAKPNKIKLSS